MTPLGLQRPILQKTVNFPVCLAPMVGLSHLALRRLVRQYMPVGAHTIWPTEMLSSRRLPTENVGATPETLRDASENGLVPQILGNEETSIAQSVERLQEWGAEGIDINMGCPVQKALKHNYGVALMGDAAYASEVVRMTVRHARVPVSVKLRAGEQRDMQYLRTFVRGLEDAGAQWVCLHPRLASEKRRGRAQWQQIRELRESVSLSVIGNGDVQVADDALRMLTETECDMVMIGRALTARPWMMWQIAHRLGWPNPPGREGAPPETPIEEGREFVRCVLQMLDHCEELFDESVGLRKFRFYLRNASPWLEFGHHLCALASQGQTFAAIRPRLLEFLAGEHVLSRRTELRN
jgi:nifR3 family TIM-barrel protein